MLLDHLGRTVPLERLSPRLAEHVRALPIGPCLLELRLKRRANGSALDAPLLDEQSSARPLGSEAIVLPGRRVRSPEGLRVAILKVAGLEFRPAAMAHELRALISH